MKISDLPSRRTDESLGDLLARTGIMGSANKAAALSKQQQEQAYKIGLKDFTNKINGALKTAVSSGAIAVPQTPQPAAAATPVDYDTPTAQRRAAAGQTAAQPQQTQQPQRTQGQTAQTAQSPTTPTTTKTAQPPKTPTTATASTEPDDDAGGIMAAPGKQLELHDKSDRQMTYYKTDRGWFNAANERITNPKSFQYLDQLANAGGGEKFSIKEVPIPPPPANITKGGKQADAQANRAAKLAKKNQQRQQQQDDDEDENINESYRHFNWLVENRILSEQNEETISKFVQDFIAGQTSKFPQNSAYVRRAGELAKQAESEYLTTQGISAELSKQLWDLIWAWSQIGGSGKSGNSQQSDDTGGIEELDSQEQQDMFKVGQFLQKSARDPSMLDDPEYKPFVKRLSTIAKSLGS